MKIYQHNFTLSESAQQNTSPKARNAYSDSLRKSGFKPFAADRDGNVRQLPKGTRVGEFAHSRDAIAAIDKAEKTAEAADPGKFFRESSNLSEYAPLRTRGRKLTQAELNEEAERDRDLSGNLTLTEAIIADYMRSIK